MSLLIMTYTPVHVHVNNLSNDIFAAHLDSF